MRLHVAAVGRLKTPWAKAGCADFLDRPHHPFTIDVTEVRDVRRSKGGDPRRWRAEEAEALQATVPAGATLIALDERGRQWSSRGLAQWLGALRDRAVPCVSFLVGGPDGLDPALRAQAQRVWSLGELTLPHELARLVLVEQLYRACSILRGSRYHRD